MITLLQYAPALGLPNASPFCLKLETWLRMAELEYTVRVSPDPRKTPQGKLPVIEHDGRMVADSDCAIAYLEKAFELRLNKSLNPAERGQALALQRLLEEHSYWCLITERWLDDETWPTVRQIFFGALPAPLRAVVPGLIRRKIRRDALGQGLLRHPREERLRRFAQDLGVLAAALGEKPYFGGYQPANIDACTYGFLAQFLLATPATALRELTAKHNNLVAYTERMRSRYYGSPG